MPRHALPRLHPPTALLWLGMAAVWWLTLPGLLGVELPRPVLVLGLVTATVPLLVLGAFKGLGWAARKRLVVAAPHLSGPAFGALLASALLLPVPVVAYALGLPVVTSLGLVLASHLGTLAAAALAVAPLFFAPDLTGLRLPDRDLFPPMRPRYHGPVEPTPG